MNTLRVSVGVVLIVVVGAMAWYFASPLVLNRTVNEDFPIEMPTSGELGKMTQIELDTTESTVMDTARNIPDVVMDEKTPDVTIQNEEVTTVLKKGVFRDADSFHQGSGDATLYNLQDGGRILRLEEFSVTNGPDLRVLLVKNGDPTKRDDVQDGYIELGKLKGNMGNQNYEIPDDVDVSEYESVVIYCKPFHVIFSVASLSSK
jgi:hypothetical protein